MPRDGHKKKELQLKGSKLIRKKKTLKAGQSWSVGHVDNPVWESLPSGVLKRVRKIPYK